MGRIPVEINQEIFRKYPDIAKILHQLRGFNWDFENERITAEKTLQLYASKGIQLLGPDASNNILFDPIAGRLYIRGNDSILHISNPRPGGAAGLEIGSEGSGDRFAYFDLISSGNPGAVDYSGRFVRNPGANGAAEFRNTGTGGVKIGNENSVTPLQALYQNVGYDIPVVLARLAQASVINTTTETTVFSVTIPAGIMGTNRGIHIPIMAGFVNTSGAGRSFTVRIKVDGTSYYVDTTISFASNASSREIFGWLVFKNQGAANSNRLKGWLGVSTPGGATTGAGDLGGVATVLTPFGAGNAPNVDTANAVTLSMTIQISGTTASYFQDASDAELK